MSVCDDIKNFRSMKEAEAQAAALKNEREIVVPFRTFHMKALSKVRELEECFFTVRQLDIGHNPTLKHVQVWNTDNNKCHLSFRFYVAPSISNPTPRDASTSWMGCKPAYPAIDPYKPLPHGNRSRGHYNGLVVAMYRFDYVGDKNVQWPPGEEYNQYYTHGRLYDNSIASMVMDIKTYSEEAFEEIWKERIHPQMIETLASV